MLCCRTSLLAALTASLLGACLDAAEGRVTGAPSPTGSEPALLVAAQRDGQHELLRFTPATEALVAFDGPLPGVAPATHHITRVWTDAEASRAVAVLAPLNDDGTTARVLASAGDGWTLIREMQTAAVGVIAVSPQLTLVWTDDGHPQPNGTRAPAVHRIDGTPLYESERMPWDEAPKLAGWAPDDSFWIASEAGELRVWRPDGASAPLAPATGGWNQGVRAIFETSVLLAGDYPALTWVDLAGTPLDVPGFEGDLGSLHGLYQVVGDTIARLTDRAAEPIATLPGGWGADDLTHCDPAAGCLLSRSGDGRGAWATPAGEVIAEYHPIGRAVTPRYGGDVQASASHAAPPVLSADGGAAIFTVTHFETSGDAIYQHHKSYDLWRLNAAGASKTAAVDLIAVDAYPTLRLTADARHLVWVADGALQRLDVRTLEHRFWAEGRTFVDALWQRPSTLP